MLVSTVDNCKLTDNDNILLAYKKLHSKFVANLTIQIRLIHVILIILK